MSDIGQFVKVIRQQARTQNPEPVQIGEVITLKPFSIKFQGVDIGVLYGDTVYINHLMLDENINLDLASMDSPQTLDPKPWIADNSPNSDYTISGTQKQFLTDLYNWTKAVHDRYILHIGDYVAVQQLGNNTYLILEKVQKIGQ